MFCPLCKAEYRPGFTRCADCEVDLVYELPVEVRAEEDGASTDLGPLAEEPAGSGARFCPLCLAEFREGFTECNECRVPLVTRSQAASARVRLWKGERQQELDRILIALASAEIPSHYKESLSLTPKFRFATPFVSAKFDYEVWIFRSDLDRAEAAIREEDQE
jgi:hypothetical protein